MSKNILKQEAIKLRKKGLSYREISQKVSVSKSTLSLWLRDVELGQNLVKELESKQKEGAKRGALARREGRIKESLIFEKEAKEKINSFSKRDLLIAGTALYWAEGTKEKEHRISQTVYFSNSDVRMIKFFVKWLEEVFNISRSELIYELYIHRNKGWEKSIGFWEKAIKAERKQIRVYFKKDNFNPKRKNIGESYHGLLKVRVGKSSRLTRKISFMINAMCDYCGIV